MSKRLPDLVRRQRALTAVMAKFGDKPFELGRTDCVKKLRYHLVKMGHRGLPEPGRYHDDAGAQRALKAQGVETIEELIDLYLPRIAPAAMLPGDIGLAPAERGAPAWRAGTVVISVGRKFLGWHPDKETLAVIDPAGPPFIAAWRA